MRSSKKIWLYVGLLAAGCYCLLLIVDIFVGIETESSFVAMFSYPAVSLFVVFGITDSQPWPIYLFLFGILTNFCFGAVIGYLIQILVTRLRSRRTPLPLR